MSSDLKWLKRLDTLGMPVVLALRRQRQGDITSQGGVQPGIYKALCLTLNCALHVSYPPPRTYSAVTLCWQFYYFLLQVYLT